MKPGVAEGMRHMGREEGTAGPWITGSSSQGPVLYQCTDPGGDEQNPELGTVARITWFPDNGSLKVPSYSFSHKENAE
jgi:hypothetical protein